MSCINTNSKEFKSLLDKVDISSATLELIIHKIQNTKNNAKYPSVSEINEILRPQSFEGSETMIEIWSKQYSSPINFPTIALAREEFNKASRIFGKNSVSIIEKKNGTYDLVVGNPSFESQYKSILAKAPRDAEGNLLAPNGKKSNLTERQYAQVRTKAFKDWFGDWENANKENPYSKDISIGSPEADFSNVDSTGTGVLIPIFLNGEYIGETGLDNALYHKDKGMSIKGKYMEMPSVGGSNITIEKEYRGKGYGKATYFELAKLAANNGKILRSAPDKSRTPASTRVWESLVRDGYAKRVNDRYEIINSTLNNASKVVDENGEPLVVYHGSAKQFNAFKLDKIGSMSGDKSGFYFTNKRKIAKDYYSKETGSALGNLKLLFHIGNEYKSSVYDVFLNSKNPYIIKVSDKEYITREQIIKEAKEQGYDSILFNNVIDGPTVRQDVRIVFNPNQIKSATDNVGTFSKTNDDIRYREVPNSSFKSLDTEMQENLLKKGWTAEKFDSISQEERDQAIKCIAF